MKYFFGALIVGILIISACVRESIFSDTPQIQFIGQSKNIINQGALMQDSLFVQFDFQDGDGDIGSDDSINVFVTDTRQNVVTNYKIPFIETNSSVRSLEGSVTILLFSTCCIYDDNSQAPCTPSTTQPTDEVLYTIQIRDRAGNLSNIIEMNPITVNCN